MGNQGNLRTSDSYKWVVLSITVLLMMGFAITLQALPPLFEQMMEDIAFSNSQAGLLMGAFAMPGIFLPFFVAVLAKRYDLKKLIIVSLAIMIIGMIAFSFAGSYSLLFLFRLVTGIGATVVVILAPLLITIFFDQKNMGIAMGIFNMAVPLGTVLAANVFRTLGLMVGWREIIFGIGGLLLLILLLVLFFLSVPEKEKEPGSPDSSTGPSSDKPSSSKFRGNLRVWFLASIWSLANLQLIAYMTFGPQFYQSIGLPDQRASFLTSLIMFGSIVLAPIVGVIFDKTGRKKPYLFLGSLLMLISFGFMALNIPSLSLWAIALGIGFSPIPVFVFAYLPEIVEPNEVGMGLGMLTVASNLGVTVGPSALGAVLDLTAGNFLIGFMFLAVVSLVVGVLSLRV